MLLKLILPLVTFAAFRVVMYSDHPELIELRAQLYAVSVKFAASHPAPQAAKKTNLQELHARTLSTANPCAEVVCAEEGAPADQIRSGLEPMADQQTSFTPKFVKVKPAD